MPVYEYVCDSCGHEFEEFSHAMSGEDFVTCPECDKPSARRKLSVFAARVNTGRASSSPTPGSCGRCGDPDGPCAA